MRGGQRRIAALAVAHGQQLIEMNVDVLESDDVDLVNRVLGRQPQRKAEAAATA